MGLCRGIPQRLKALAPLALYANHSRFLAAGNIALIGVSILGSITFIILLFFANKINSNILVLMAVFPLALIAAAYSIYRGEHRFFVLTDQRLLSKPGWGETIVIEFSALEAVSIRYNWLALIPELEVKHVLPEAMAPRRRSALSRPGDKRIKTDFVDSVEHLEAYRRFLESELESFEEVEEEYDA